ncbi:MAG TPA: hypothetical protein VLA34_02980, partial [Candidatus Krumholzibacterium sp.]|nr:hypothetical protein [Candidatus Krumholzibacterium sp.]
MNRWKRFGPWMLILGLLTLTSIYTGCSGDDPVDPVDTRDPELDQLQIICRELSPAPGELTRLTIQVEGYSPGEWPTYTWDDGGAGTFVDGNTGISVEWLAPDETGLYRLEVIGTLGGLADTTEKWILVRNFEELNTGRIFSCHPRFQFSSIYFYGDADGVAPRNPSFKGYMCYKYMAPGVNSKVTQTGEAIGGGFNLYMPEDGSVVTGSFIRSYFSGLAQQRQDLWIFPLSIGSPMNVTNDGGGQI